MLGLILAVVTSATASPLPIIITTESSPVCQALREKVAPAISRVLYEDRVMAAQRPLERWPQANQSVYALALNWVKLDEVLNPDTFFHSNNPADNARMESLRERLQKIADDENNALNILSGAMDTYELEALAANGPHITFDRPPGGGEAGLAPGGEPQIVRASGPLEAEYLRRQALTQRDEIVVAPMLQPLIAQCKEPNASP